MTNILTFNSLKISNQYIIIDIFRSNKYDSLVLLCNNSCFVKENYGIDLNSLQVKTGCTEHLLENIQVRREVFMEHPVTWTPEFQDDIFKYQLPEIYIVRNFPHDVSEITVTIQGKECPIKIGPAELSFIHKKCLTTIQLNEVLLIESWIDWHKKLGFEHFFIYDNNFDATNYTELFQKYAGELFVYNANFPFFYSEATRARVGQCIQQCHTLWKFSPEYLGLTDLDEYIYPVNNFRLFDPTISVLSLPNYWFGCNNRAKFNPKNFTRVLTKRKATQVFSSHRKCIVKSSEVDLPSIHIVLNYSGTYKRVTHDEGYLRHYLILSSGKRRCDCSVFCQVTDEPMTFTSAS